MAEKLGEAVLELRTDDSGLNAGMAQAKASALELDRSFASAGGNVERSLARVATSGKATGVVATELAVAAQTSARAAMDQAAGFGAAASAARVNTLAMRESLVVARELSRGNFTRLPGSLTLLAQGIGSQGGLGAFASAMAQQLGIIKQVQNAELAEAATAAANAAAGVEAAARVSAAKVMVADTEIALAEAQLRAATTSEAEDAAQARLAVAHEAVAAAATEATIAEDALAVAMGRANEAQAASAAASRIVVGTVGAGLIGLGVAVIGVEGAFKALQATVDDSGSLDRYAQSLVKTKEQLKDLEDKVGGFQVTWGDVFHGVEKAASDALDLSSAWNAFKEGNKNAFASALGSAVDFAARCNGVVRGSYQTIVNDWGKFPSVLGNAFYSAVNIAIDALNKLVKFGTDQLNTLIAGVNKIPGVNIGKIGAVQIAPVGNPYAGAKLDDFSSNVDKFTSQARAQIQKNLGTIYDDIIGASENRIKGGLPKPKKPKQPKKPKRNAADDELAKLAAQIAGENELTQAYLTSDAAVIKAEADQKAMTLAVEKHATASQTAALKQKELALAIATIAAEGAKAISNLNADAAARAKVNAMVAAGLIPASQANQALANELALRQQLAALTLAQEDLAQARHANDKKRIAEDIAAIQRLQSIIQGLPVSQAADEAAKNVADAQAQIAANDNEIAQIRLKNALLGSSNKEIATALANLQAMQYLKDHPGVDASTAASLAQSYVDKANASIQTPFQQWAATVPQTAKAIGDVLESDAVKGINDFNDGLAQAIVNGGNLFQVLHQGAATLLADLIKLAEQEAEMAIFKAIMGGIGSIAGGLSGGSLGGGDLTSGGFDPPTSLPGGDWGSVGAGLPGFAGGHALGGMIPAGMFGIVGEKGPEPIIATPKGAMVLPNSSLRQGFGAANDRAPSVSVTNYNDFRGADAQSVAAMSARIDEMERDLPGRVVSTMQDAKTRLVWR